MVDFGSGQGRSIFVTAGVVSLRRGWQKCENAVMGQKMPFMDGQQLSVVVAIIGRAGSFTGDHAGAHRVHGSAGLFVKRTIGRKF